MEDWRAQLAEIKARLAEAEVTEAELVVEVVTIAAAEVKRAKVNRGRGELPLLRPSAKVYRAVTVVDDDTSPPVFNFRRSPMER